MSKVLVIPDVHLKTWIFDKAVKIIEENEFDNIVLLGDLVDDWDQELNIKLYKETLDKVYDFVTRYPETLLCLGNHDVSYLWEAFETGYSVYARNTVVDGINKIMYAMPADNVGFIHKIDNVLFSHAGLTERFLITNFGYGENLEIEYILRQINQMGMDKLWNDHSPIWARPQNSQMRMYPPDMLQIVGHTPVKGGVQEGNLVSTDNFSTYRDGTPIGDEKFIWVDTEKMEIIILE